ncbi:MAG: UDP-N-acetylmuramoyl-tripeptide--D-alanyl-D-alanine ligase [Planctomycetaceae bacterium]|nr:UDP-N-acetylmuramoyl-tripeptide--D-alanyl-D-alanine ligase [Planctomycetaceae bacterium]
MSIDSRTVRPGEVFWCLPGSRQNGHSFAAQALSRGARACVVSEDSVFRQLPQAAIRVPAVEQALTRFAAWYRQQQPARVIGVTGSVGKTTTRELLWHALSTTLRGSRSPRNWNNHLGVPLSLCGIERSHAFAVLELGASESGEIARLARLATPEIAVITAVGLAHVAGFGSREQIIHEKGSLVAALPADGLAVLNGDDPAVRAMARRTSARVILAGEQPHNSLRATDVEFFANQLRFTVDSTRFELNVPGRHFLLPALLAVAVAREFGIPLALVAEGLRQFVPVAGRCRLETIGPWTVIDDSYNASPESMTAASQLLAARQPAGEGRRIFVAGDMLELGPLAANCHFDLGGQIARAGIDLLAVCGEFASQVKQGALAAGMQPVQIAAGQRIGTVTSALENWLGDGDTILVKGSRGMRLERVTGWLREQALARAASAANPAATTERASLQSDTAHPQQLSPAQPGMQHLSGPARNSASRSEQVPSVPAGG